MACIAIEPLGTVIGLAVPALIGVGWEKLTTTGYDTDAEMRTDVLFGLSHAMVDVAHSLRALAAKNSPSPGPPKKELGEHITRTTVASPRVKLTQTTVKRLQDSEKHTCIECGRTGTRRFVPTGDGAWRCAPSATACIANKPTLPAEPASDIPAEQPPVEVTPPAPPAITTPGVTARCQDCTRTFTLTGRVLQSAVELHELKHSHIVTVLEVTGA